MPPKAKALPKAGDMYREARAQRLAAQPAQPSLFTPCRHCGCVHPQMRCEAFKTWMAGELQVGRDRIGHVLFTKDPHSSLWRRAQAAMYSRAEELYDRQRLANAHQEDLARRVGR